MKSNNSRCWNAWQRSGLSWSWSCANQCKVCKQTEGTWEQHLEKYVTLLIWSSLEEESYYLMSPTTDRLLTSKYIYPGTEYVSICWPLIWWCYIRASHSIHCSAYITRNQMELWKPYWAGRYIRSALYTGIELTSFSSCIAISASELDAWRSSWWPPHLRLNHQSKLPDEQPAASYSACY